MADERDEKGCDHCNHPARDVLAAGLPAEPPPRQDRDLHSHMMVVATRAAEGKVSKENLRAVCRAIAEDKNLLRKLAAGLPVQAGEGKVTDEELARRFTRCAYPGPNPMYRCNGCGTEEFGVRNLLVGHALACDASPLPKGGE